MNSATIDAEAKAILDAAPAGSRVMLFGSHARGTTRPDSDLDFLVIEPTVQDRFAETFRLRNAVEAALGEELLPVDLVVTDEERYLRHQGIPNTLAYEVAREGRMCG